MKKYFFLENEEDFTRVNLNVAPTDTMDDIKRKAIYASWGYIRLSDPITITFGYNNDRRVYVAQLEWVEDVTHPMGGYYGDWEDYDDGWREDYDGWRAD